MAIDLDEAQHGRDPSQKAQTGPLGFPRWVGLVTEVGELSLRGNPVVHHGETAGIECLLADLLGKEVDIADEHDVGVTLGERGPEEAELRGAH
ncbi:MAG TPA: hypothetical protein VHN14_32765 [Kofleriaceae bacterium]|nr:hypothetical protein [Kofleriaceae bacterium]